MNWSDVILSLLALATVFVLVVLVFVLKSIKQVDNKIALPIYVIGYHPPLASGAVPAPLSPTLLMF